MTSSPLEEDIALYGNEALARFGMAGSVFVAGEALMYQGPQPHQPAQAFADLGPLRQQWPLLTEEARRRRAGDLVRGLASRERARAPARRGARAPGLVSTGVAVVGLAAVAVGAVYLQRETGAAETRRVAKPAALSAEAARSERAQRVCDATQERVLRGGTVGLVDAEGWVVDVWLAAAGATEPLERHAALERFVQAGPAQLGRAARLVWSEEPALSAATDSDSGVVIAGELIAGQRGERTPTLRLTFQGRLADAYFLAEQRRAYFHIATALSDALGASHAAVVARCAHRQVHHAGSWFRGADAAEAAAALVYVMGTYAEPPHLAAPFLRPPQQLEIDRSVAWASVRSAQRPLDQAAVALVVGRSGGMISGPRGGPAVITFPFDDSNRATRASYALADVTHIAAR